MPTRRPAAPPKCVAAAAVAIALAAMAAPAGRAQPSATQGIDAFVFDGRGRPVTDLRPSDFTVTIDGRPRRIIAAHPVYRGPGAEVAARAASQAAGTGAAPLGGDLSVPLAEPWRTILVVVDELSFPRGLEKAFASATDRLLDRFGPGDRLALVTLPLRADRLMVSFSTDRVPVRERLARLTGRAPAVDLMARAGENRLDLPVVDPAAAAAGAAGAAGSEGVTTTRPAVDEMRQAAPDLPSDPNAAGERKEHPLDALGHLLDDLRIAPGPKTVVLVTAGLPELDQATGGESADPNRNHLQSAESAAIAARAVVHVLGVQGAAGQGTWAELDRLARDTGGELVRTGRNIDPTLDRLGLALSGLYELDVEPAAGDEDAKPRSLKVEVRRPSLLVRAAQRFVPRNDPPFLSVAAQTSQPIGARDLPDERPSATSRPADAAPRSDTPRDVELETIVARAVEYAAGYFRDFRNVVAEEDYRQTDVRVVAGGSRRLKSDFLLATTADGQTWVPFRDVFEVDGKPVRDRDERLRKLFLEAPAASAMEAAAKVQAESARYNVQSPRTTVNVPTTALTFLLEPHLRALRFHRGRDETVEGMLTLRVDFEETGAPTYIQTPEGTDIPARGSFWIDPLTGRIIRSFVEATAVTRNVQATNYMEATVLFRRSDRLGMWVPAEMHERYQLSGRTIEGDAKYSNFRSFQVRTEQEIKIPK